MANNMLQYARQVGPKRRTLRDRSGEPQMGDIYLQFNQASQAQPGEA